MGTAGAAQSAKGEARRRAELEFGSAAHWLIYVAVDAGLLIAAGGLAGSWWRLAGWGLGLAIHTLYVVVDAGHLPQRMVPRERAR